MEIRILTALLAPVALVACSTHVIEYSSSSADDIIGFGTYLSKVASRSYVIDNFSEEDSFGIFAYYTVDTDFDSFADYSPNYMYNQAISTTDAGNTWSYTPLVYWPIMGISDTDPSGKVSFFAYYPYVESNSGYNPSFSSSSAMTTPRVQYTVQVSTTSSELLWAVDPTTGLPCKDRTKENGVVSMQFQHAVARVGAEVKLAGDILDATSSSATVTINYVRWGLSDPSLKADNFVNDYISDLATPSITASSALYVTGCLELNNTEPFTPLWTETSGGFTHPYTNTYSDWCAYNVSSTSNGVTTYYDYVNASPVFKSSQEYAFDSEGLVAFTAQLYNTTIYNRPDRYLMLIPQDVTDVYVYLVYTIEVNDDNIDNGTMGGSTTQTLVSAVPFSMGEQLENGCLEGGKAYTYSFTISLDGVEMSVVDVSDEWNNEVQIDMTL